MRIVIAGGTGFLGSPLAEVYAEEGHDVRVLTRGLPPGESRHDPGTGVPGVNRVGWRPPAPQSGFGETGPATPQGGSGEASAGEASRALVDVVSGADAVINLAGASIADGRWTPARKQLLRDSRILSTRSLAAAIKAAPAPPRVFISGSAAGYYGPSGDEPKTEESPPGRDFLAQLCVDWEAEAAAARRPDTRLVLVRTGIVLEQSGGALHKMLRPFRMFVGGPIGSGRQYMSWIHRIDWLEMVRWIVDTPQAEGPINATAPHPVTNREFSRALGRALRRPSLMPVPGFALKIALGELAEALTTGQRVLPERAKALKFHFRYPEIDQAFRGIFEA
jgi:uncharacterized protein (TIGR01777 family)